MKISETLEALFDSFGTTKSGVFNKDKGNLGAVLFELFVWQYVENAAKRRRERAWKSAQDVGSVIPKDEELRKMALGEHIVAESDLFSCVVKIGEPRMTFSRDEFIKRVAAKYKLSVKNLAMLADECKVESEPVLTKRVVEA